MSDPKLVRATLDEALLLSAYRGLKPEDQSYIRELIDQMTRRWTQDTPSNVVLLSDPHRKFR